MAKTDEEKVREALAAEVEEPKVPDEPKAEPEPEPVADKPAEPAPEDKPQDEEPTFTKPEGYEWVKGDTLEEFNKNLLIAYENSTAEALRLRQTPAPAPAAPDAPAPAPVDPALSYAQSMMQKDMVEAFDVFAKKFPQSREPQGFDMFQKASQGASQAFVDAFGRVPTYPELFEKTAAILGWQPSDKNALKDAAIKDAASSGDTSATSSPPPKRTNIDTPNLTKTLEIARRIPGNADKSDAELVKELQTTST